MGYVFMDAKERVIMVEGLPSLRLASYTDVIAVKHPNSENLFVIRSRYEWDTVEKMDESEFIHLSGGDCEWNTDYTFLQEKNVIIDSRLLNKNAQKFLDGLI